MSDTDLEHLRLLALDADDLSVMSCHLQDAVVKVGDLAYLPERRAFALLARRFDWEGSPTSPRRRLSGLHFDGVLSCRSKGIDRDKPEGCLSLMAVTFEPATDAPSGTATLVFAGGGSIELKLECIEARLKDLGPMWSSEHRPAHNLGAA